MKNNFNFLRLLFAVLVLITHSYKLSGSPEVDALHTLTHGQLHFSYLGLFGLFALSGYLVFQSLCRSQTLLIYFWKRVLRIFPALLTVLALTVVFGYVVYNGDLNSYFHSPSVRSYIPNHLFMIETQYNIEGIFENNVFKGMINGSLWSIPYEVAMYLCLGLLFFLPLKFKRILIILIFCFLLFNQLFYPQEAAKYKSILNGVYFLELAVYFFGGGFLAAIQIEKLKKQQLIMVVTLLLITVSLKFQFFDRAKFFLLPILVISTGLSYFRIIHDWVNRLGDLSYGVYLYAFPVQQTLMYYFRLTTFPLMIFSFFISMSLAWLSWHVIEKRAMNLKRIFNKKPLE